MNEQLHKTGLGLRREFMNDFLACTPQQIDFLEIAPENWMAVGGKRGKELRRFTALYSTICHGLSLSIGGPAPLNLEFVQQIKGFLETYHIDTYSEHLSYCGDNGLLYDLLPIPFTEEAIHYVSDRVRQVQDILGRRIALENVSYYCAPGQELREVDFINGVLREANCGLLLDVNNVFVNSFNHGYDAKQFIDTLDPPFVSYIHIAGHDEEDPTVKIDTHGEDIIHPVWDLLDHTYQRFGVVPTLLERDFNIPSLNHLLSEVEHIKRIQQAHKSTEEK